MAQIGLSRMYGFQWEFPIENHWQSAGERSNFRRNKLFYYNFFSLKNRENGMLRFVMAIAYRSLKNGEAIDKIGVVGRFGKFSSHGDWLYMVNVNTFNCPKINPV